MKTLCDALDAEAVDHHLRRAVGLVVAIGVGHEDQIRGRAEPHAAEAERDAAQIRSLVPKDFSLVEAAVAVAIFENHHPVVFALPAGIGQAFDHPQPAPIVERHGDRLHDVRLGGKHRGPKPSGSFMLLDRLSGRQRGRRIVGPGGGAGRPGAGQAEQDWQSSVGSKFAFCFSACGVRVMPSAGRIGSAGGRPPMEPCDSGVELARGRKDSLPAMLSFLDRRPQVKRIGRSWGAGSPACQISQGHEVVNGVGHDRNQQIARPEPKPPQISPAKVTTTA